MPINFFILGAQEPLSIQCLLNLRREGQEIPNLNLLSPTQVTSSLLDSFLVFFFQNLPPVHIAPDYSVYAHTCHRLSYVSSSQIVLPRIEPIFSSVFNKPSLQYSKQSVDEGSPYISS